MTQKHAGSSDTLERYWILRETFVPQIFVGKMWKNIWDAVLRSPGNSTTHALDCLKFWKLTIQSVGKDLEELQLSVLIGEWDKHFGKQRGRFLKCQAWASLPRDRAIPILATDPWETNNKQTNKQKVFVSKDFYVSGYSSFISKHQTLETAPNYDLSIEGNAQRQKGGNCQYTQYHGYISKSLP